MDYFFQRLREEYSKMGEPLGVSADVFSCRLCYRVFSESIGGNEIGTGCSSQALNDYIRDELYYASLRDGNSEEKVFEAIVRLAVDFFVPHTMEKRDQNANFRQPLEQLLAA